MKKAMKLNKLTMFALGAALTMGFTACDDDDVDVVGYGEPIAVTAAAFSGATDVAPSTTDINVTFNTEVEPVNISKIMVNDMVPDEVTADGKDLTIRVKAGLQPETEYTVTIYPFAVRAADEDLHSFLEETYTFRFTTGKAFIFSKAAIPAAPVNPNATEPAKKLYSFLLENYGSKTLTGAMGGVAWESAYCDFVAERAGKYPAIVGFDYIHHLASAAGENWINYADISPVKNVWDAGSIPAICWHWAAPQIEEPDPDNPIASFENVIYSNNFDCSNWGAWLDLPTAGWSENLKEGEYLIFKTTSGDAVGIRNEDWSNCGGTDYTNGKGNIAVKLDAATIADIQASTTLHISGSVVITAIVHADTPALEPQTTYTARSKTFSPRLALQEGTSEHATLEKDIEIVANYLKLLQDAGIPVLWRPFHEAAGDYSWGPWFWWGNDGVDVTKELWVYLYNRLTNDYKLNNLIWVWTMQTSEAGNLTSNPQLLLNAYPGDQYVDIVGVDSYENETGVDATAQYRLVANTIGQSKIIALSEIGNFVDFQTGKDNDAVWSFFMNWYTLNDFDEWSLDGNSRKLWRSTVNLPFMLSRGEFSVK